MKSKTLTSLSSRTSKCLIIVAHPDDAEIFCGGTIVLLNAANINVNVLILSYGECGGSQPKDVVKNLRSSEAENASKVLGYKLNILGLGDLEIIFSKKNVDLVKESISQISPDFVITHYPVDYQSDHEETSKIVRAACFQSTIPNSFDAEGRNALIRRPALFYCSPLGKTDYFGKEVEMEFSIDITSVINHKINGMKCHQSQYSWLRIQHGITDINSFIVNKQIQGVDKCFEYYTQHLGHGFEQKNLLKDALR